MRKLDSKIMIGILIIIGIMIMPNIAKAALQANKGGTSKCYKSVSDFFLEIRQMEAKGGTLGKETGISTNGTGTTKNGIDCHMIKNTEFGTAVMLAASDCGSIITNGTTDASTTGNESGIYQMANGRGEFVAAGGNTTSNDSNKNLLSANDYIYKNIYDYTNQKSKVGDAMLECQKWYGSTVATWITSGYPLVRRGYSGFFSYGSISGASSSSTTSRAAVVCGSSFN